MASKWNKKWYRKKVQNVSICQQIDQTPKLSLWNLYFEDIEENEESHLRDINHFFKFIENNKNTINFADVDKRKCIYIDFKCLINDDELTNSWPRLKEDLLNNTEYCMKCIGFAVHKFMINEANNANKTLNFLEKNKNLFIRVGLTNYDTIVPLKDIKVNYHYGKLVAVRGTVIKASNVRIIAKCIAFSCNVCNETQLVRQLDFNFTFPIKCTTTGCKAKQVHFQPLYSSVATKTCKLQTIKIQEKIGAEKSESGGVPRTLECQLMEDLVKSCIPGDDVTIIGVIKIKNANNNSSKNKNSTIFSLFLDCLSIVNNKTQSSNNYGNCERQTFNIKDYYCIQEIHSEPKLFRLLVQSLCPNIYGHEIVKAGLLLALFGGTRKYNCRSESHVLMVGDPGLGKSQMLKACSNVSPKSIYVCGNTSTTSGLTVTMTRESGGEYVLEAGALMLADQGCCCIDEFDKMPTQHACLLEAMQQQSISIAKAGVVSTLPARTSILAAANPVGGHYNKSKTIAENLKISSPMLSRFDLIFILLDQPNQDLDKLLTKHVMDVHSGKSLNNISNNQSILQNVPLEPTNLRSRLMLNHGESLNLLPASILRKYIMYAQKYVNPILNEAAKNEIINYYTHLRKQFQFGDSAPVTTRQLNSLIRLTQARAKCELREEATVEDVLDVIEIVKHSLIDIFTDEFGVMDTTRSQNSSGLSSKNQAMKLLKILQQNSEASNKSLFTLKEIREFADRIGLDTKKFYDILNSLNVHGFLLNKGQNKYQLVSAYL